MTETWQDKWEGQARLTTDAYRAMPEKDLLLKAAQGFSDPYYSLWYVISERCALKDAARPLFLAIQKSSDMLTRYHAAENLWKLLETHDYADLKKAVQFGGIGRAEALIELDNLLKERGL